MPELVTKPTRMWSVTVLYRQSDKTIYHQYSETLADSFWEAIGSVVESAPHTAQELISISCLRI